MGVSYADLRYNWSMNYRYISQPLASAFGRALQLVAGSVEPDSSQDDRPQLDGSDLMGDYNFRTGRLDCSVDPYGWYEEDV